MCASLLLRLVGCAKPADKPVADERMRPFQPAEIGSGSFGVHMPNAKKNYNVNDSRSQTARMVCV